MNINVIIGHSTAQTSILTADADMPFLNTRVIIIFLADGLSDLVNSALTPKPLAETPPPTYEEALFRQSVRSVMEEGFSGSFYQDFHKNNIRFEPEK